MRDVIGHHREPESQKTSLFLENRQNATIHPAVKRLIATVAVRFVPRRSGLNSCKSQAISVGFFVEGTGFEPVFMPGHRAYVNHFCKRTLRTPRYSTSHYSSQMQDSNLRRTLLLTVYETVPFNHSGKLASLHLLYPERESNPCSNLRTIPSFH